MRNKVEQKVICIYNFKNVILFLIFVYYVSRGQFSTPPLILCLKVSGYGRDCVTKMYEDSVEMNHLPPYKIIIIIITTKENCLQKNYSSRPCLAVLKPWIQKVWLLLLDAVFYNIKKFTAGKSPSLVAMI